MWTRRFGFFSEKRDIELQPVLLREVVLDKQLDAQFNMLPVELIYNISTKLDCKSLISLSRTSQYFKLLVEQIKEYQSIHDLGTSYLSLKSQAEAIKPSLFFRITGSGQLSYCAYPIASVSGAALGIFADFHTYKSVYWVLSNLKIEALAYVGTLIFACLLILAFSTAFVMVVSRLDDWNRQRLTVRETAFNEIAARRDKISEILEGDLPKTTITLQV
jgi:sensor histidine kinase YesM